MGSLIKQAKVGASKATLSKAGDANHDPANLNKAGAKLLDISLDSLTYNPRNPRDEDLATDPETQELAESFAWLGQLEPAVVVSRDIYLERYPELADDVPTDWVLMMGNRRKAAARLAKWRTLECIVRDQITDDLLKLDDLPFHENLHRKGINALKMAHWLATKKKELGSQEKVAKRVGKTQPWVAQLLKLLDLIPQFQALIQQDEITASIGRSLAALPEDEQRLVWERVKPLSPADRKKALRDHKSFMDPDAQPEANSGAGDEQAEQAVSAQNGSEPPVSDEPETGQDGTAKVPSPRRDQKSTSWISIRVAERSPERLADALVRSMTREDLAELVDHLARSAKID